MFEVYYLPPTDPTRELRLAAIVALHGGHLVFREAPEVDGSRCVCLTYEFALQPNADKATSDMQAIGEYVEGPYQYT